MRPEHWIYTIPLRLQSLFRRRRVDQELDDELRDHVARKTEDYVAKGMSPQEARHAALIELGGFEQAKEECRDTRKVNWLQDLLQDLRFGLRMLRKSPGFTAIAVLTLALGIGANASVFGLADRILIRPLPYRDAGQLVWMTEQTDAAYSTGVSWLNFQDWNRMNQVFSGMAGYRDARIPLAADAASELVTCRLVTANYFQLMGVEPALGRVFQQGENIPGGPRLAILSYEFWRDHFGASPQVLGRTLQINSNSFTVIGVMPQGFGAVTRTAIWMPFEQNVPKLYLTGRDVAWLLYIVGRRKPGVSFGQARSDMDRVGGVLAKEYPAVDANSRPVVKDLRRYMLGDNRSILIVVVVAVGLLLLITCVNLTSLLLVKIIGRRREFSVRMALGAGGKRVFRQVFTEGSILAATGSLLGSFLAWLALHLAPSALPANLPLAGPLHLGARGLLFILGIASLSTLLIGLIPAMLAMRSEVQGVANSGAREVRGGHHGVHRALIVCEIALAMAVLVGTGLLVRTMHVLLSRNIGFDPRNLLTSTVSLPLSEYPDLAARAAFMQQGIDRLKRLPGVDAVAAVFPVPFTPQIYQVWLAIQGRVPKPGMDQDTYVSIVSAGYLKTMKIPILEGRDFEQQDTSPSQHSIIVDRGLVTKYWPGESPVGKSIKLFTENFADASQPAYTIIGVAAPVRAGSLTEDPEPRVYVLMTNLGSPATLVLRTSVPPLTLARSLQDEIHALNRGVPVFDVTSMQDSILRSQLGRDQAMRLLLAFSVAALLLAVMGIYGVASYLVGQRTKEIGVRMALGAHPRDILWLVFVQGAGWIAAGACLGAGLAFTLGRFMRSLLYEVGPGDGLTYAVVAIILVLAAFPAIYIPARRAMKVDPMVALRYE